MAKCEEVDSFFTRIEGDFKDINYSLHCLVNNAGVYLGQSLFNYSSQEIDRVIDVNLKGLIYFTRFFVKSVWKESAKGIIVNIASVAGEFGSSDAIYALTKAGTLGMTKSNAMNLAPNIRVNAISPGLVHDTKIFDQIPKHRLEEYQRQELLADKITPDPNFSQNIHE